jgi:hypothetical protein
MVFLFRSGCGLAFDNQVDPERLAHADHLLTRERNQTPASLRSGILRCIKKPSLLGMVFLFRSGCGLAFDHQVDPERFELSSKHGTNYAFYVLSCCLIVGKGKVNRLPIPSSVGVLSCRIITPLNPGQSCFSMLLMSDYRTESDGTKAYLILN